MIKGGQKFYLFWKKLEVVKAQPKEIQKGMVLEAEKVNREKGGVETNEREKEQID